MGLICPQCGQRNRDASHLHCRPCRFKRQKQRAARKEKGLCGYFSCQESATAGTRLCPVHREYFRTKKRERREREREKRREEWLKTAPLQELLQDFDAIL